jgi:uncharacterized protein (DUF302 family)
MNTSDQNNISVAGIISRKSHTSVSETMDLLARSVSERGATVYVRIDQQAEALKAGIEIPPLEFLLFGNPGKGAALMASDPMIALDLPLKIICWQDQEGKTMVAFNDQDYITRRYALDAAPDSPLNLVPVVDQLLK